MMGALGTELDMFLKVVMADVRWISGMNKISISPTFPMFVQELAGMRFHSRCHWSTASLTKKNVEIQKSVRTAMRVIDMSQ